MNTYEHAILIDQELRDQAHLIILADIKISDLEYIPIYEANAEGVNDYENI